MIGKKILVSGNGLLGKMECVLGKTQRPSYFPRCFSKSFFNKEFNSIGFPITKGKSVILEPYRLEMGTSLENSNGKNLYEFWGSKLTNRLNNDIKDSDSTYLLNLASNEYFKAVKPKDVKAKIITPVFKDWKNGEYKMISFFAKKARGLMASYQLKNKIKNPNDLKGFNEEGYVFNEDMSKNNNYVFTRIQQ